MTYPPVFISGWFCSGTTALWSAYRRLPGHVAFYEPLHANLTAHIRHTRPKPSHIGVKDYWQAYRCVEDLEHYHRRDFAYRQPIMEQGDQYPALEAWLERLMNTEAKRHVLKFNRVGLRLPWLKSKFPQARIVHLRRNPRDVWVSTRRHLAADQWDQSSHLDAYETAQMAYALAKDVPLLLSPEACANAYHRLFILWLLTDAMAAQYADVIVELEKLKADPFTALTALVDEEALDPSDLPLAASAIKDAGHAGFSQYRPEAWFEAIELAVQAQFVALGLNEFPQTSLAALRAEHLSAWQESANAIDWPAATTDMLIAQSAQLDVAIAAHAQSSEA